MLPGTVIIESVWLTGRDEGWLRCGWETAGSPTAIEVWCETRRDIMRERYLTRARHVVHDDQARIVEWDAAADVAAPISGFPVIHVDTSEPVDIAELAMRVRTAFG